MVWWLVVVPAVSLVLPPAGRRTTALHAKYFKANGEPIAPKLSAYMHFCNANRASTQAELKATMKEEYKNKFVMVRLAEKWQAADVKTKATYQTMSDNDKKRYLVDIETAGYSAPEKKKKAQPKRPKSAYLFFCAERRPSITAELKRSEGANFKSTMVLKVLGSEWQALTPGPRAKYQKMADDEKMKFAAANP